MSTLGNALNRIAGLERSIAGRDEEIQFLRARQLDFMTTPYTDDELQQGKYIKSVHAVKMQPEQFNKVKEMQNVKITTNGGHVQVGDSLVLHEWLSFSEAYTFNQILVHLYSDTKCNMIFKGNVKIFGSLVAVSTCAQTEYIITKDKSIVLNSEIWRKR